MRHGELMVALRRTLACVLVAGLLASPGAGVLAQGASPSGSPPSQSAAPGDSGAPASPCVAASGECPVSPAPFSWPSVQFLGGNAAPVISSTCGVPGVDTFHLVADGVTSVNEFDVFLSPYDPAFLGGGWPGTVEGTMTSEYDVVPCFGKAVAVYDPSTGVFDLSACQSNSVPMSLC